MENWCKAIFFRPKPQALSWVGVFLSAVFLTFAMGCASIAGNRQLVMIDSAPRGATVYLEGETKPIGQTPLIHRLQRVPNEDLRFVLSSGQEQTVHHQCQYRWTLQVVGNGIGLGAFFGVPGALVGLAIDYATGAAFDCGNTIRSAFPEELRSVSPAPRCQRLAIIPPVHGDPAESEAIAKRWRILQLPFLGACDRFLDYGESEDLLLSLSVGHGQRRTFDQLEPRFRYRLVTDLEATHFVELRLRSARDQWQVQPVVYDAYTGQQTELKMLRTTETPRGVETLWAPNWLASWTASILPNSVAWQSLAVGGDGIESQGGASIEQVEEPGRSDLAAITNFTLFSVEHPNGYDAWDYGFSLYPAVDVSRRNVKVSVREANQDLSHIRVRGLHLIGTYRVSLTGHTPLGAFSTALGLGYFAGQQSVAGRSKLDHGPATTLEFGYTAFLTENLFFRLRTSTTTANFARFDDQPVYLHPATDSSGVEIGYFFPRMRRFARSLL
jgi:hypothetical protein